MEVNSFFIKYRGLVFFGRFWFFLNKIIKYNIILGDGDVISMIGLNYENDSI